MVDKGIPRSHYKIMDADENLIGEVTSGTMSPSFRIWCWSRLCQEANAQNRY